MSVPTPRRPWAILLLMNDLDGVGGSSQLLYTLAFHLRDAGHEVAVYTEYPPAADNRYAAALRTAGIPLNAGVGALSTMTGLRALLLPARIGIAVCSVVLSRRPFAAEWRRVGERLNRALAHYAFNRRARAAFAAAVAAARRDGRRVLAHVHRGAGGIDWATALRVPTVYLENSTPTSAVRIDRWWAAGHSPGSNTAKVWRRLRRRLRGVDLVVAGSERAALGVREHLRYRGPIAVLPWMVDAPAAKDLGTQAQKDAPLAIGCAGRLEYEKGHVLLIQAMSRVLRAVSARLVIAGDGSLRPELERLAAALGVREQIEFLGDQSEPEMERFWNRIDLFVLPSLREGSPLVVLEAMARGVPVIAADVGGVNELLDGGRCGRVVAPGAEAAFAEAVVALAADPAQRAALAAAGHARFMNAHAPAAALPLWLAAYARVLDGEADRSHSGLVTA